MKKEKEGGWGESPAAANGSAGGEEDACKREQAPLDTPKWAVIVFTSVEA